MKRTQSAENTYAQLATQFCNAIKTIADKPENLANLELYLTNHFSVWLEKYANTPELLTLEIREFAEMEI